MSERVSQGDPDARFYKKKNGEKSKLGYQNAFSTDIKEGIITRVITITGCENMTDAVVPLIKDAVVPEMTLDGEFSLGELIALAQDKGMILNVPMRVHPERDVYSKALFQYDFDADVYICPKGNKLKRCSEGDGFITYRGSSKTCKKCPVVSECTKSKTQVRTIRRDQYELEWKLHEEYIQSDQYQFAKVLRGILAEGKFFEANVLHGLNNARYVGKKLMHAQAQMTAVVLNLKRFLKALLRKEYTEKLLIEEPNATATA